MTRTGKIIVAAVALIVAAAAVIWAVTPKGSGSGTYDELIALDGYFAELVSRQRMD